MWELFQKIQKYKITPDQCLILFAFNEDITPLNCGAADLSALFEFPMDIIYVYIIKII